mgnify:CR=1 FL=1
MNEFLKDEIERLTDIFKVSKIYITRDNKSIGIEFEMYGKTHAGDIHMLSPEEIEETMKEITFTLIKKGYRISMASTHKKSDERVFTYEYVRGDENVL